MRERWARWLALTTGLLVLLLAAAFAAVQNPPGTPPTDRPATPAAAVATAGADRAQIERGRALFAGQGCQRCHSVAGEGSPRSPLDGVGDRLGPLELRHWIVADPAVADEMGARTRAAKQPYAQLDAAELDALVAWLQTLR